MGAYFAQGEVSSKFCFIYDAVILTFVPKNVFGKDTWSLTIEIWLLWFCVW